MIYLQVLRLYTRNWHRYSIIKNNFIMLIYTSYLIYNSKNTVCKLRQPLINIY
uniref:Uncharacterized protein n=1 Tax=Arundo donax TaxID=35708 RepID=A0A0A9SQG8_ARUDO